MVIDKDILSSAERGEEVTVAFLLRAKCQFSCLRCKRSFATLLLTLDVYFDRLVVRRGFHF